MSVQLDLFEQSAVALYYRRLRELLDAFDAARQRHIDAHERLGALIARHEREAETAQQNVADATSALEQAQRALDEHQDGRPTTIAVPAEPPPVVMFPATVADVCNTNIGDSQEQEPPTKPKRTRKPRKIVKPPASSPSAPCRVCGSSQGVAWAEAGLCANCIDAKDAGEVVFSGPDYAARGRLWLRDDMAFLRASPDQFGTWHMHLDEGSHRPTLEQISEAASLHANVPLLVTDLLDCEDGTLVVVFERGTPATTPTPEQPKCWMPASWKIEEWVKPEDAALAWRQLCGYPEWWGRAEDHTAQVERRMIGYRCKGMPEQEADGELCRAILSWRQAQQDARDAGGEPRIEWGHWCEFTITILDVATPITVLHEGPFAITEANCTRFYGDVRGVGGRTVWAVRGDAPIGEESLTEWAVRIATREYRDNVAREQKAARRSRKKHPTVTEEKL